MASALDLVMRNPIAPVAGAVVGYAVKGALGAALGLGAGAAYAVFGGVSGLKYLAKAKMSQFSGEDDPFAGVRFGDDDDDGSSDAWDPNATDDSAVAASGASWIDGGDGGLQADLTGSGNAAQQAIDSGDPWALGQNLGGLGDQDEDMSDMSPEAEDDDSSDGYAYDGGGGSASGGGGSGGGATGGAGDATSQQQQDDKRRERRKRREAWKKAHAAQLAAGRGAPTGTGAAAAAALAPAIPPPVDVPLPVPPPPPQAPPPVVAPPPAAATPAPTTQGTGGKITVGTVRTVLGTQMMWNGSKWVLPPGSTSAPPKVTPQTPQAPIARPVTAQAVSALSTLQRIAAPVAAPRPAAPAPARAPAPAPAPAPVRQVALHPIHLGTPAPAPAHTSTPLRTSGPIRR